MRLLDTDVVVDTVRGFPPARQWLNSLVEQPGLPGIAMMELVEGCANKADLWRVQKLVSRYTLYWPSPAGCQSALDYLTQFYLSHNLNFADALIAATAVGQGATLCTFNVKHFAAVPGLVMEQPYARA